MTRLWSLIILRLRRLILHRATPPADQNPSGPVRIGILSCGPDEFCQTLSLYEAFSRDSCFAPAVIPYRFIHEHTVFFSDVQSHEEFFRKKGLHIISQANIRPTARWWKKNAETDSTKTNDIDIFFSFNPYADSMEHGLRKRLRKKTMCYVPYGALVNYVCYQNLFYNRCWKIFVDHPLIYEAFAREKGRKWADAKCVVSGQPKLDGYKNESLKTENYWPRERSSDIKRVLLLDHWSLEWCDPDEGSRVRKGYSQFCRYKEMFLTLPKRYPGIDFVFRPHPLLFDNLVKSGRMTPGEQKDFIRDFSSHPNAVYDNAGQDYVIAFRESDGLIASGISCLVEYLPSEKPILFLEKSDGDDLNAYGKMLITYHDRARNEADVFRFLERTVVAGRDSLREKRIENMKKHFVMPPDGSGVFIRNHIKHLLKL